MNVRQINICILFFLLLTITENSYSISSSKDSLLKDETRILVDSIINMKEKFILMTKSNGWGNDYHYEVLKALSLKASNNELVFLTSHEDKYVKSFALFALILKNAKVNYYKIFLDNFNDERSIETRHLDTGGEQEIWSFFKNNIYLVVNKNQKYLMDQKVLSNPKKAEGNLYEIQRQYSSIFAKAKELPKNNHYDSLLLNLFINKELSTSEVLWHLSERYYNKLQNKIFNLNRSHFIEDLTITNDQTSKNRLELILTQIDIIFKHDSIAGIELLKDYLLNGFPSFFPSIALKASQYKLDPSTILIKRIKEEDSVYLLEILIDYAMKNISNSQRKTIDALIKIKKKENGYSEDEIKKINTILLKLNK